MHVPSSPGAFFRPGCLLTCIVSGEENLIKVAQVSWVWALAAAVARMCMILSRADSLKGKAKFCICVVRTGEKPELSDCSADDARVRTFKMASFCKISPSDTSDVIEGLQATKALAARGLAVAPTQNLFASFCSAGFRRSHTMHPGTCRHCWHSFACRRTLVSCPV